MSKNLKRIMVTGAALLTLASVGTGANDVNVSARHVRSHKMTRINEPRSNQNNKQPKTLNESNKKQRNIKPSNKHQKAHQRSNKKTRDKRHNKRLNKKQRAVNHHQRQAKKLTKRAQNQKQRNYKHAKKNQRVLKPKFRRSNSPKLLKQSGFYDLRAYGPDIMNKYAPNSRKAVISKNVNVSDVLWLKGHFLQKNPTVYQYKPAKHGWIQL